MALDKNKIIAEATKLIQKGAWDKAIQAYQKILAEDPREVRSLLKIGELHQKKGDDEAAAQAFEKVAETYAEQGFFLKAVAVYKQIVKLAPEDVRVNERLAGLYQQLGLMSDAMSQYQLMASAYEKAGDGTKLTDVLKRMIELDPDNVASSIKLGELYVRSSQAAPALDCFRRAADHLKLHNRADEYLRVAERISALTPGDAVLTRDLANLYLAKGDTKRALAKLQLCFKNDPKDVETLQLLAQAFRDLGQVSKTVSVYKELARVHDERGRANEASSVWRKVLELAPGDEDAAAALAPAPAMPPPRSAPVRASAAPSGAPGPARAPPPGPPPGAARVIAPPPPPASAPDAAAKLLTETDVYVKYGLHDKALDHLKKVLAIDPECVEARERARDVHLAAGRPEDAGREAVRVVRALLARGDADRARDAVGRLREIAPAHRELRELTSAVMATEEVALGAGEAEEELVLPSAPAGEQDDDALALAAAGAEDDEVVEDDGPAPPAGGVVVLDADAEEADEADEEAIEAARASAADEIVEEEAERAAGEGNDDELDLSDELEEAEFFVQQGLFAEAREALHNLLAFYPAHSAVQAKLAEIERRAGAAAGKRGASVPAKREEVPPLAADADESFDIARELAEELGPPGSAPVEEEFQYSVEDVFNQFKKGVEQTVRREDSATHYDLGIAYKEMGLLDDAVHEFETALEGNDRTKEVDCLSMIGLCRLAQGAPREAVKAYRRALASDHLTNDAAKAIHYDLATAYEGAGDREAALYYYQRVAKADPRFRDAPKRAGALGGGPGRAPPDEGRPTAREAPGAGAARPPGASPSPRPGAPAAPPGGAPKKNIGYL